MSHDARPVAALAGEGEGIEGISLIPHPGRPPSGRYELTARLTLTGRAVRIEFRLSGAILQLVIPQPAAAARTDNLWEHTCFELFVRSASEYVEFNFSPSTQWAAYRFSGYREGMATLAVEPPVIGVSQSDHDLTLVAEVTLPDGFEPDRIGLSAVIEEDRGRRSYWAVAHPPGDTPDFHHPDCFAIEVAPASDA